MLMDVAVHGDRDVCGLVSMDLHAMLDQGPKWYNLGALPTVEIPVTSVFSSS